MGWIGWPADKTLATDVNSITLAVEARGDLLSNIFGSGSKPDQPKSRKMTAERWRSIVRRNNARFRKPARGGN